MKTINTFKRAAYMFTMVAMVASLTLSPQATIRGYAAYRDKNAIIGGDYLGHSGIVDATSGGVPTYVVHHPGTGTLTRVSFENFKTTLGLTYYGEFYKPGYGGTTYTVIANLAYNLYNNYDIYYVFSCQMTLTTPTTSIPEDKIMPQYVYEMRCDGLVEYCYEYHGIELLSTRAGGVSYWDISDKVDYNFHVQSVTHSPIQQMGKLTLS